MGCLCEREAESPDTAQLRLLRAAQVYDCPQLQPLTENLLYASRQQSGRLSVCLTPGVTTVFESDRESGERQ